MNETEDIQGTESLSTLLQRLEKEALSQITFYQTILVHARDDNLMIASIGAKMSVEKGKLAILTELKVRGVY